MASEDELPVGWSDVVVVVDSPSDGWALFFDGVGGLSECVVERVVAGLDEVIRIAPDLSGGEPSRVDGRSSTRAALRLIEHDVAEADERIR